MRSPVSDARSTSPLTRTADATVLVLEQGPWRRLAWIEARGRPLCVCVAPSAQQGCEGESKEGQREGETARRMTWCDGERFVLDAEDFAVAPRGGGWAAVVDAPP
uniref:Uncharacterized protein n=1 Tax=Leishmania guyanensis TaxID=5670 RepID=A0A1E1IZ06_LEIGU|nr:Hypothetical protein BN36_2640520 [Leishmania guyanensis]CCM16572.1 Hypothetical protein BN36_2640760 [Leishmania guyanensis]